MNRALKSTGHQQDIIDRFDLGDLSLSTRRDNRTNLARQRHQPTVAQNMGLIGKAPRELGQCFFCYSNFKILRLSQIFETFSNF